jgi:hypothetical protein
MAVTMAEHVGTVSVEEFHAICHLRGQCHNSAQCPICTSEQRAMAFWKARGRQEAITEIAEG